MAYKYNIGNIFEQNGSYRVTFGKTGSDNYITEFFGKTEYDNPKKEAETFHKKIVDSGWSSASGKEQASPLKDAIRNAYKEIKKGKNTTTNDIYQKIKNLKIVKKKDKNTIFSAITKRLAKDNLPYKKGATIVIARRATEDARLKEKLKQKVNQPTLVTKEGGKIAGILYPESGPRSKENFIKSLREYDSTPKVQKGLARKLAQFRNKFFPDGTTKNTLDKILIAVRKEEKIPPRPTREPNVDKVRRISSVDKFSKKDVERILKKGKKVKITETNKVLDLAHKLSLATSRRFNIPQPTQSLALQQPFINRIIGTQYERKLNKLYDLQQNLIKNKPADYKRRIERLNRIITSVVNDSDGRVIGVVIDEKTLKPRMYGNVEVFKDTVDQGFFDKDVKNMTKGEAKFVVNNLYKDALSPEARKKAIKAGIDVSEMKGSLDYARGAGADISKIRNVNIEELKTAAKKSKKLGGPNLIKAIEELAKFPETTKSYGAVGTAMDKEFYKKISTVGCPGLAKGGRVGFATGSNCFDKGVNAIKSGNIEDGAQSRNFTKLMDSVKTGGARAATSFLKLIGKGKTFAVTAGVGVGAGALVKAFRNDDPTTYLTNDKQANAMILDTADQLEREERQAAVGDAPELLDESAIGAELAVTGAAIPGSKKVFDARRKKGFGAVRAGLGPVGKALSGFATPLGIAATTPLNVARQVYEGESVEDIATNPLNYLGPAFAGTLTKEATVGMPKGGMLNKALRLGMSPAGVRGISKFFGLPGLALSLGYEGYDQYKKYTEGRGFVYNLLNKDE